MNRGSVFTAAVIAAFIIGAGVLGYWFMSRRGAGPAPPDAAALRAEEALRATEAKVEALRKETASLLEETRKAAEEKKALEEKVASLMAEVEAAKEGSEEKEAAATRAMKLAFGEHAAMEELVQANWREMAEAAEAMAKLSVDLIDKVEKGEDLQSSSLPIDLAKENAKLVPFALKLNGKLPTHSSGNGEFTHPIAHWNFLAERLEVAGAPLTEKQVRDLNRLGEDYDREWVSLQDGYGESTVEVERVIDELDLKKRYTDKVEDRLTKKQRDIIVNPVYRHMYSVDVHSPMLLVAGRCRTVKKETKEEIRESGYKRFAEIWGLEEAGVPKEAAIFDRWLAAVEPALEPVNPNMADLFRFQETIIAGRAQVALMKEIIATHPVDDGTKAKIAGHGGILVPRLVKKE